MLTKYVPLFRNNFDEQTAVIAQLPVLPRLGKCLVSQETTQRRLGPIRMDNMALGSVLGLVLVNSLTKVLVVK